MGDGRSKKRVAIIVVSTILLVGMVVGVTVGLNWKKSNSGDDTKKSGDNNALANKVKAVKSLCAPTDYKSECQESLMNSEGNSSDPKQLIMTAFNITIDHIKNGLRQSDLIHKAENDPRAKEALHTCQHLMDLSIGELQRSLGSFQAFDFNNFDRILMNLKVWLSGAITYQETCIDGFDQVHSDAGQKMKDALTAAMHMSSNGLAIINDMSDALSNLNISKQGSSSSGRRRLLNDGDESEEDGGDAIFNGDFEFPDWIDENPSARKLLSSAHKGKKLRPNLVVAKDGSGKYTKISHALKHVPKKKNTKPFIIYIKEGVYEEYVEIEKHMDYVVFIGDGGNRTRITGNKNFTAGVSTFRTCTVAVEGDRFIAINIGIENTAGPDGHQAVAVRVQSDLSIFYKVHLDGYQDTLYAHTMRQFYRDCVISGTIDFVFGDGAVVMQNCTFVVRKPNENQQCIVTAQGRKERHQPSALVIQGGSIVADPKYYDVRFKNKAYLARPWKDFSRTIIMDTFIDDLIDPEGYLKWDANSTSYRTCWYGEYNNTGPGSDRTHRAQWNGIKNMTAQHALDFTPLRYYKSDFWIRQTRIPYIPGIMSAPLPISQNITSH